MDIREVLDTCTQETGWSTEMQLELCLRYIESDSVDDFEGYLKEQVQIEKQISAGVYVLSGAGMS
jgi:hypothetical protein